MRLRLRSLCVCVCVRARARVSGGVLPDFGKRYIFLLYISFKDWWQYILYIIWTKHVNLKKKHIITISDTRMPKISVLCVIVKLKYFSKSVFYKLIYTVGHFIVSHCTRTVKMCCIKKIHKVWWQTDITHLLFIMYTGKVHFYINLGT